MAANHLTFDQASERLLDWYLNLRVEYLSDDELNHELESRLVVLDKKMDLSRRRKFLRDKLKTEKQSEVKFFVGILNGDAKDEAEICMQKYEFIKAALKEATSTDGKSTYYTRLVHVGARIAVLLSTSRDSPNLHSHLQNILVELVELLEHSTSTPTATENVAAIDPENFSQVQRNLTIVEPSNIQETTTEEMQNPSFKPRDSMLSQADLAWIVSLQNRIKELEKELARRKGVEIGTQTFAEHTGMSVSHHQIAPNPFSASNSDQTFPIHSPIPGTSHSFPNVNQNLPDTINSNSRNPHPVPNSTFMTHNPSHQPYPVIDPNPRASLNPQPILQHHQIQSSIPNPPPQQNPIGIPTVNNPFPLQQYRHTLPVSKWNIAKYGGDDQGLKLNEFLELVQALSQAEHVSEQALFDSAIHLFTGSALNWYMTQRATGRLLNWQHLVFELRRTYMHPDLDALIKIKIYQRRQQKHESFHEFYFELEKMFRTMSTQIPNYEKMQIIQQNMRLDYKRQMTFLPISDLETLVAAGQKLDALNFSAYSKVLGLEKSVQAVQDQPTNGSKKNSKGSQQTQSKPLVGNHKSQNQQFMKNRVSTQGYRNTQESGGSPNREVQPFSRESTATAPVAEPSGSQNKSKLTLVDLLNNHTPPPANTCFNCGRFGHHEALCRLPREIFCSACGLHGFPTDFCPFCTKNKAGANENRRLQNPSA